MSTSRFKAPGDNPGWSPSGPAVDKEWQRDADGTRRVTALNHPGHPFERKVDADADVNARLRDIANEYLDAVAALAGASSLAERLKTRRDDGIDWLDIRWGHDVDKTEKDPRLSFWVERVVEGKALDRTAVLMAGHQWRDKKTGRQFSLGSSVGLRLVVQLGELDDGGWSARVTGATFSGVHREVLIDFALRDRLSLLPGFAGAAAKTFGFQRGKTSIDGLSPAAGDGLRISGSGVTGDQGGDGARRVYAWGGTYRPGENRMEQAFLAWQVTHAMQPLIQLMPHDPASRGPAATLRDRRPTRQSDRFDGFRAKTTKLPPEEPPQPNLPLPPTIVLADHRNPLLRLLVVHQTRLGNDGANPDRAQKVPDAPLDLRSDDLAASHAYLRGKELFDRLQGYGLQPGTYFKHASLPLVLRHRAPLKGANDGVSVNAQVGPMGPTPSLDAPIDETDNPPPQLEVRFGAANLSHRALLLNDAGRPRAQYLGLAADPRWAWHEFGHVLSYAATGALEFPFAHSAGDALAAIVADPDSQLALDPAADPLADPRVRFHTFPWVQLNRRHDRDARSGWCWCGKRNTRRQSTLNPRAQVYTGYFAEQLLSSSLFRLYRAIGGDTFGDRDTRCSASDYSVYLIMRAIQLLGPNVLPAADDPLDLQTAQADTSPNRFVWQLIHADTGTSTWDPAVTWPEGNPPQPRQRIGGMVRKVVRWAFERQGLYATDDPYTTHEGEGLPPRVDVHIPGIGLRHDGSYAPVALTWSADPAQPAGWHADPGALLVEGGAVQVTVDNRGTEQADDVSVTAWAAAAPTPPTPPNTGPPLTWLPLTATGTVQQSIGSKGTRTFTFDAQAAADGTPLTGDHFVLASVTCPGDRSNLDPATLLPCALSPTADTPTTNPALLTDLVACDNNLGLRILSFP